MESTRNILLLDGDEKSAHDIQRFLKVSAFTFGISHASDIHEGLNYVKNRRPDIVLLDAELVEGREFAAFKSLLEREHIPVILLADMSVEETKKRAETAGASDYLVKNKVNLFHLQKTILNTLKINDTESKLGDSFSQFTAQRNALYKLLDKTASGILIINDQNIIQYGNEKAYSILAEDSLRRQLADHLKYRELEEEELVELRSRNKLSISMHISEIDWNDARANLFVLDRILPANDKAVNLLADEHVAVLLNSLTENVVLLKADKIVFANKTALKELKLKRDEIVNRQLHDILESSAPLLAGVSVHAILEEKRSDGVLKLGDGAMLPVKMRLKPMNLAGEYYQLLSFEIVKEEATQAMPKGRSGGGEDKFSTDNVLHLASHDLREPVRTILNYVQLISENIKNEKYKAASEYADFARSAADRMEKLLSDFKIYIALSDHAFSLGKVSMKMTLTDVLKQMKPKIEAAGAELNIAELPDITADRELVEKLLMHLIDNSLKFHKKGKKPVIDIGFDKFEGNVLFCIRDNGIGVSKRYQGKIFDLFERLNRVDEYTGNGLGLAICKKIVELHGGKIWVESLPGFGSSFYFTLSSR